MIGGDLYDHLMSREQSLTLLKRKRKKIELQNLWDKWLWARFGFAISSCTNCMSHILQRSGRKEGKYSDTNMSTLLQNLKTGRFTVQGSTGYNKYYLQKAHNKHFKAINKQLCCSYQLTRKRDCWSFRLLVAKCLRQLYLLLTCPPNIPTNITLQLPILPFRTANCKPNSKIGLMNCNITKRSNMLAERGLRGTY